jgi:radical SAM superfamily enzyme YgiQ (UPF0313 family)
MKILYLFPNETIPEVNEDYFLGKISDKIGTKTTLETNKDNQKKSMRCSSFLLGIVRISNYLNSRKNQFNELIEEEYIDLRYENLPHFSPKNIKIYRNKLKKTLIEYYKRYQFDILAISCYTSYHYINCVEIANLVKRKVSPSCIIVVGGIHPSICPEDFQIGNFPDFIYEKYQSNITPFDFLIHGEGEIPFFKLVKGLIERSIKIRYSLEDPCIMLEPEVIKNLNDLPLIDFSIYKKYEENIINCGEINIDFSRGCPFQCKMCTNSTEFLLSNKSVRLKSITNCLEELKIIKNTKWLSINTINISDPIFIPKRSKRQQFFNDFKKLKYRKKKLFSYLSICFLLFSLVCFVSSLYLHLFFFLLAFTVSGTTIFYYYFLKELKWSFYSIRINDHLTICSKSDLENYKELNITPLFNFVSASKTLLYRLGIVFGKNLSQILKGIDKYLKRFEEIVKVSNDIDLIILFYYYVAIPGSDQQTIKENKDFFLKKRFNGKSLVEQYDVNFKYINYAVFKGTKLYDECESEFGSRIFYRKWWKRFDDYSQYYSALIDPSEDLNLTQAIKNDLIFFRKVYKAQIGKNNPLLL